jgi:hypothetical protein
MGNILTRVKYGMHLLPYFEISVFPVFQPKSVDNRSCEEIGVWWHVRRVGDVFQELEKGGFIVDHDCIQKAW